MAAEHTGTEVAVPGAAQGDTVFPPFDQANFVSLVVWLAITFGLLYLLMAKVALPRVQDILKTRMAKINADIAEANRLRGAANAASKAYDQTLAAAKGRSQALAQETQQKLAAEADARRHALESDLNAKLAAAEAEIGRRKAAAMANVGDIARDATAAIVERLTGKPADPAAVTAAVAATQS
jgi:F-type H+-transporting ATPase subunit b